MADMQGFRRCALPLSKRIDGPDVHQFVSGHTVVDRVKRHGLVAVRRQQLESSANRHGIICAGKVDTAEVITNERVTRATSLGLS